MARIVVIGAGIGGVPAAYELQARLGRAHQITVVNAGEHFHFIPSNPWLAVGKRSRDEISVALRPHFEKKGIEFIAQAVASIDAEHNQLHLADARSVDYDYLVITTGPRLAFEEVPGSGPVTGFTHSICTVDHAEKAFADYQRFLEAPGPVIVGAMPGASCFGPAYEFAFVLDADLRRRKLRNKVPITYVSSEPYVGHLGLGGVGDSKSMLESELRSRDIKWITNARTTRVDDGLLSTSELDRHGNVVAEHAVPFRFAMMLPAFKGVDAVAAVEGLCNARGFVQIDAHQRSPRYPNIFSAGVCVAIPPVEATPVPTGAPKTGYMIETMVTAIVENIAADLEGREAVARGTWNAICLADMGDTGAAFVALPQLPPRNVNWFKKGKWVHLAKIAFEKYFMHKVRSGSSEPVYEKYVLKALGIFRLEDR